MKNLLIVLLFFILESSLYCQNTKSINTVQSVDKLTLNIETDQCGNNVNDLIGDQSFDWRSESFTMYTYYAPNGVTIPSPFYPQGTGPAQPNTYVYHFGIVPFNQKDFHPEDGWVEYGHDFGTSNVSAKYPYIILYNKFTGVMRFFILVTELESSSVLRIEFKHSSGIASNTNDRLSASFAFQDSLVNPLIDANPNLECNFIYPGGLGVQKKDRFWIYHDITIAYDPCICNSSNDQLNSGVSFLIKSYQEDIEKIKLSGNIQTEEIDPSSVNNSGKIFRILNSVSTAFSSFSQVHGTYSTFKSRFDGLEQTRASELTSIENNANLKNKAPYTQLKTLLNWLTPATQGASAVSTVVPFVGLIPAAFSFVNALTSKEQKGPEVIVRNSKINLAGTGVLEWNSPISFVAPFPNSYKAELPPEFKPVYQNTLGVFHLPYKPKILKKRVKVVNGYDVFRYSLEEPIKYLLNPASEVDPKDVKVSLLYKIKYNKNRNSTSIIKTNNLELNKLVDKFKYTTYPIYTNTGEELFGPVILGSLRNILSFNDGTNIKKSTFSSPSNGDNYTDWVRDSEVIISDWKKPNNGIKDMEDIVFSTALVPITQADKLNFLVYSNEFTEIEIVLQVYLNTQSRNNSTFKNASVFTYRCDYEPSLWKNSKVSSYYGISRIDYNLGSGYNFSNDGFIPTYYFENSTSTIGSDGNFSSNYYLPTFMDGMFENTTFGTSNELLYGGKVTLKGFINSVENETVTINACDGFNIEPGTIIGKRIILTSKCGKGNSELLSSAIMKQSEIESNICGNVESNYYRNFKLARAEVKSDSIQEIATLMNLNYYSIFPNPANNTVTIQAPKSETVISEIVLKNLLGMEVQRFVIKNPSSDVTIDVSTIPVGLYILNVNNFSTRLGIQR